MNKQDEKKSNKEFIKTGIKGLDSLMENGIQKASSILIAGGAGTGKTNLCLQILANQAAQGKNCYFIGFEELEDRLIEHMEQFGLNPKKPIINETVNFLDYSSDVDGIINSYNWNFGDGTSSKDNNPSHNYKKAATYQVTLEVTDDDGETESIQKFVIIYPPKKPNETGIESIIIYIVYIVLFIIMIAFVFMIKKKVG